MSAILCQYCSSVADIVNSEGEGVCFAHLNKVEFHEVPVSDLLGGAPLQLVNPDDYPGGLTCAACHDAPEGLTIGVNVPFANAPVRPPAEMTAEIPLDQVTILFCRECATP